MHVRPIFQAVSLILILLSLAACRKRETGKSGDAVPSGQYQELEQEHSPPADLPSSAVEQLTGQLFMDAALNGNMDAVKEMLEKGVDPNTVSAEGRTALMLAAFNGHTEIVRLLLAKGASLAVRDPEGRTPLLYAATGPFPATVTLLIREGADPDARDSNEGFTPLMHASAEGHYEVVKILLNAGADPLLKDIDGETAEIFARNNGHEQVAELLRNAR